MILLTFYMSLREQKNSVSIPHHNAFLRGQVWDEQKNYLTNVLVILVENQHQVYSDNHGKFLLNAPKNFPYSLKSLHLRLSKPGFFTQDVIITSLSQNVTINLVKFPATTVSSTDTDSLKNLLEKYEKKYFEPNLMKISENNFAQRKKLQLFRNIREYNLRLDHPEFLKKFTCADCHYSTYIEWNHSEKGKDSIDVKKNDNRCFSCHLSSNTKQDHCFICHRIQNVTQNNSGDYQYHVFSESLETPIFAFSHSGNVSTDAMKSSAHPLLSSSTFCFSCHDAKYEAQYRSDFFNYETSTVEMYLQWSKKFSGKTCQHCHLQKREKKLHTDLANIMWSSSTKEVSDHSFKAPVYSLLSVDCQTSSVSKDLFFIQVTFYAEHFGHDFPTGKAKKWWALELQNILSQPSQQNLESEKHSIILDVFGDDEELPSFFKEDGIDMTHRLFIQSDITLTYQIPLISQDFQCYGEACDFPKVALKKITKDIQENYQFTSSSSVSFTCK